MSKHSEVGRKLAERMALPRRSLYGEGPQAEVREKSISIDDVVERMAGAVERGGDFGMSANLGSMLKAKKSSEGGGDGPAAERRRSRSAGARRPVSGGKAEGSDGEPLPIGPQVGVEPGPSEAKKGGRPRKDGPRPWELMDPPISKAEYYRRKKAGPRADEMAVGVIHEPGTSGVFKP